MFIIFQLQLIDEIQKIAITNNFDIRKLDFLLNAKISKI